MPKLVFTEGKTLIGEITAEQLQFLQGLLVEEDSQDRDYYINRDTLDMLESEGCEEQLLARLKEALGDKEEMDVSWTE
jgi:processive 1,2-diacylglycerol beta-glucosyltransferase